MLDKWGLCLYVYLPYVKMSVESKLDRSLPALQTSEAHCL